MPSENKRHGKSKKATFGNYGRRELALIGSPCSEIEALVSKLSSELSQKHSVVYLDANHALQDALDENPKQRLSSLTNYEAEGRFQVLKKENENKLFPKLELAGTDLVLINGNHFVGNKQVVFLDKRKSDSVKRNVHKINDILMFIDVDGSGEIPKPVQQLDLPFEEIPVYQLADVNSIIGHIQKWMLQYTPKLRGLILTGGKSTRMGVDKGGLSYHGKPQREYLADLLSESCEEVYLSAGIDDVIESNYPIYRDAFLDMGPLGAILTAFKNEPDSAWLVIACDLPLVDAKSIQDLIAARKTSQLATAYKRSDGEWPEPLFAIWEPKIYSRALQMLSLGIQCPRKLLINSDVAILEPSNDRVLINANFPEEREQILTSIHKGNG